VVEEMARQLSMATRRELKQCFAASVALPLSWIRLSLRQYGWKPWRTVHMPHAIIRGGNGRRHEVDFEDAEIRIEVYSSDETVEILVEAVNNLAPSDRRRFALLNIPKHLFSSALGAAALRKGTPGPRRV
jgi:hypothetical protein